MRQQKKWDKIKEKGANLDSWRGWVNLGSHTPSCVLNLGYCILGYCILGYCILSFVLVLSFVF